MRRTAKAVDSTGAETTSAARSITVTDTNTPPTVSLTAPANGATYTAPATVTVSATASAGDTNDTLNRVEFYANGTLIGTDTTSPYSVSWTNVAAGSYTLTAKAVDNHGGETVSAARTITVNGPPTVSLTSPANGATYSVGATVSLAATAADPGGTIARVEFYQGTTLINSDTTAPYAFDWTNVPAGSYTLTAKAVDNQGNATTSAPVAITVTAQTALYFIHADHLNTPRALVDAQGKTVWKWDNADPFGNNAPDEDPDGDTQKVTFNLRFPGQYYDAETNLHYNYFRDCYDSATGRYCQPDPVGLSGGINLYSYAYQNPLSYIYPTGETPAALIPIIECAANPVCAGGVLAIITGGVASQISKKPAANDPQYCPPPPPKDPCDEMRETLDKQWTKFSWRQWGGPDHGELVNYQRQFNDVVDQYNQMCVPRGWAPYRNRYNIGPRSPAMRGGGSSSGQGPRPDLKVIR